MKNWAFVSDFDGTITNQDFYWLIIEKYFPEGRQLFSKWKSQEILDIDFLRTIFSSINQSEKQIVDDILAIPIDDYVPTFVKRVQNNDGDFFILSAGSDYYIYHMLKNLGIKNVEVFSNKGFFREKNIHLHIDETHNHYSKRYGIDKTKVIQDLKKQYKKVYFIGDSEPDSHPAAYADLTFAKNELQEMLQEKNIPFIPVETFKEVESYLMRKGILI